MAAIRGGKALKKVVVNKAPAKTADPAVGMMGGLSVAAILARRAALAGDDDDDSDWDDEDEWD